MSITADQKLSRALSAAANDKEPPADEALQQLLTQVMLARGEFRGTSNSDRLRASELLGEIVNARQELAHALGIQPEDLPA